MGLNAASILDSTAEFTVSVTDRDSLAVPGLTVENDAVIKFEDATNDRTYLYPITMTQAFKDAVLQAEAEFRAEVGNEVAAVVMIGLEAYAGPAT